MFGLQQKASFAVVPPWNTTCNWHAQRQRTGQAAAHCRGRFPIILVCNFRIITIQVATKTRIYNDAIGPQNIVRGPQSQLNSPRGA
jgi:hypothetical protein